MVSTPWNAIYRRNKCSCSPVLGFAGSRWAVFYTWQLCTENQEGKTLFWNDCGVCVAPWNIKQRLVRPARMVWTKKSGWQQQIVLFCCLCNSMNHSQVLLLEWGFQRNQQLLGTWAWRYSWKDLGCWALSWVEEPQFLCWRAQFPPWFCLLSTWGEETASGWRLRLERRKNSSCPVLAQSPGGTEKPPGCGTWGQGSVFGFGDRGGLFQPKWFHDYPRKSGFCSKEHQLQLDYSQFWAVGVVQSRE